jgi:hypothetical protein
MAGLFLVTTLVGFSTRLFGGIAAIEAGQNTITPVLHLHAVLMGSCGSYCFWRRQTMTTGVRPVKVGPNFICAGSSDNRDWLCPRPDNVRPNLDCSPKCAAPNGFANGV